MKNFIKQHKYFILAFLVFAILAIVSGYQSLKISNFKFQISNQIPIANEQTTTSPNQTITTSQPFNHSTTKPLNTPTTQQNNTSTLLDTNHQLPVTSYELRVTNTSTVYDLMLAEQTKGDLNFKTKTFSGLGEFVEEINGLKNDAQAGKYWIYYINGESAKLGISQQIVKPNDIITWKYENANL